MRRLTRRSPRRTDVSVLQPNPISEIALRSRGLIEQRQRAEHSARPWLATIVLLLGDLSALCLAASASLLTWHRVDARLSAEAYLRLWPVLLLFPFAYAAFGLYPGFGRNPVEEFRKLSATTSLVYPALAVTIFLLKDAATYSRGVFLIAWVQTLILVPLLRALVRAACSRKPWWGYPVVVLGVRRVAAEIAGTLASQPELGLKPVAIFDDLDLAIPLARGLHVRHAILAMAGTPHEAMQNFFNHYSDLFSDVIVVPDLAGFSSLWVEARDLNGTLGLEVHQRLLRPSSRLVKRVLDVCLGMALGIVALPFVVLIAALIQLTSPGPVFYGQVRYGRGGEPFIAWKFRSMVANANQVLEQFLNSDADLREEWLQCQKLRNDPRITPLGRFLRRTSLDELPQLWNILRGQMSLVGPRPVVADEIPRYGDGFALYEKVTPGLSGLWQVSGRNNLL